jgi:hypothetical protein
MAASTKENDFVHIVADHFNAQFVIKNIADWEVQPSVFNFNKLDEVVAFAPDLIVLNIGENMRTSHYSIEELTEYLTELKVFLSINTQAKIIVVNSFWDMKSINLAIDDFINQSGVKLIDIRDMDTDYYKAIGEYWHEGVAKHPNDLGHAEIANRIVDQLL